MAREAAAHCARGGRAPHDDCHVPAEAKMHGANASPELTAASNDFEEANHS